MLQNIFYACLPQWIVYASCVSHFRVSVIKTPKRNNIRGKRLIFVTCRQRFQSLIKQGRDLMHGSGTCGKDFPFIESGPEAGKNQSFCDLPEPSNNNRLQTHSAYLWKGPQGQAESVGLVFKVWYYRDHCRWLTIPFFYLRSCAFQKFQSFFSQSSLVLLSHSFLHTKDWVVSN